jgi:hypothetical protein
MFVLCGNALPREPLHPQVTASLKGLEALALPDDRALPIQSGRTAGK